MRNRGKDGKETEGKGRGGKGREEKGALEGDNLGNPGILRDISGVDPFLLVSIGRDGIAITGTTQANPKNINVESGGFVLFPVRFPGLYPSQSLDTPVGMTKGRGIECRNERLTE